MSDDLISRKALLEEIDLNFIIPILNINMREEHKAIIRIEEIIKNMPPAFDQEKVIKKLKHLENDTFNYSNRYDDKIAFGESSAFRAAIEIVEKGGIE